MAGNSQKLNEGELALYTMQLSAGYVPVGVDLAARVFQVCYLTEKQKWVLSPVLVIIFLIFPLRIHL